MKTKILSLLCLFSSAALYAQEGSVGIGTKAPDNSAILDLSSNKKGILIPRMTSEERNKISNPAIGLKVYQTDGLLGEYSFDGKKWNRILQEGDAKAVTLDAANWSKTGDAGTNSSSNFIGTTDNVALAIKVNNAKSGLLDPVVGNTGFGYLSLTGITSGQYNTAIGMTALRYLSSGSNNVGVGVSALLNNLSGSSNVALGPFAMIGNTGGSFNTAVGSSSMYSNTSGIQNAGLGLNSLYFNTTGSYNSAFGSYSLYKTTTGEYNTAVGFSSLNDNTTGNYNTAIGPYANFKNIGGSYNLAIGYNSFYNNTSGSFNLGLGFNTGLNNASGSRNVFIGYEAGLNETGSDKLYISNSNTTTPLVYGDFNAKYVSIGDVTPSQRIQAKTTGEYNLLVKGGILTEKVKVALASTADWADYVFEEDYKLLSLDEVETFIAKNKHLPNVPSAEEQFKNGLDVNKTSAKLMEKIEELTLYVIQLNKEIALLKGKNK